MKSYHASSAMANFDDAKAPGLNDRKSVHISNIDRLAIVQPRELSHRPNSPFRSLRGMFTALLLILSIAQGSISAADQAVPTVLVSVAPYKFFVEKIAGNTVQVVLMVPAGASSHTYEPTPKQMLSAARADIWFQIGEGFEGRATKALKSHNPQMTTIDLRKGVDLIVTKEGEEGFCHCCQHAHESCVDPHIWLSAREVKKQVSVIAATLSERYPHNAKLYQERLTAFTIELDELDKEITEILKPLKNRTIMVSHPAYAYFCRDYDLKQLSIEFEGKDPTPQQLTKILTKAKNAHIKRIYIQLQYNNKGAKLIAREIGAEVVTLDPYAEQFFTAMRAIARAFGQN